MIRWDSKELLDEVRHELYSKYNLSVTDTEISNIVRAFFSMVRKIMSTTKPMDTIHNVGSIHLPGIGKIRLNSNAKRKYVIKTIWKKRFKEGSSEEHMAVVESLYGYGWRYFKWTISSGYIFIHEYSGEVSCIETAEVSTLLDAKKLFLNRVEEYYYHNGIMDRKEIKLVPFIWKPIQGIYMYTLDGKFVRRYENIREVCIEHKVIGFEVRDKLIRNENKSGFNSVINNHVFLIKDGYVGPRIFNNPRQTAVKYNQIVSILDRNTEQVLFHKIGTILEASKFLKYLGKKGVIEPYYIYKKGIVENKIIYGYKWRREDIVEDDNLQKEGHIRESREVELL